MSNLKKYHVSKNLCNPTPYKINYYINENGIETSIAGFNIYKVSVSPNADYTLSLSEYMSGSTARIHAYTNGTWIEQIAAITLQSLPKAFTTPNNCFEIHFSITQNANNKIMLNTGSTALTFEPYSADVWHDLAPQQYINGEFVDNTNIPEKYQNGTWG